MATRSTAVLKRLHMFLRLAILAAVSGMSSAEDYPLNTCKGANDKFVSVVSACPSSSGTVASTLNPSLATCGPNTQCPTAISSVTDTMVSAMKTGFTACVENPESASSQKSWGMYKNYIYRQLQAMVWKCGLTAGTLTLTTPALTTCEGAVVKLMTLYERDCPESFSSSGFGKRDSTTCGTSTQCPAAISSVTDAMVSAMNTGFTACAALPEIDAMKTFAIYKDEVRSSLLYLVSQCGLPANTVSFATHDAYVPGGFIHAVLCVVTLLASSLGMEKY